MTESKYQTVSFADITLSAKAQQAIRFIQLDEEMIICANLGDVALRLCEDNDKETALRTLELVQSVLLARNYLTVIQAKAEN